MATVTQIEALRAVLLAQEGYGVTLDDDQYGVICDQFAEAWGADADDQLATIVTGDRMSHEDCGQCARDEAELASLVARLEASR